MEYESTIFQYAYTDITYTPDPCIQICTTRIPTSRTRQIHAYKFARRMIRVAHTLTYKYARRMYAHAPSLICNSSFPHAYAYISLSLSLALSFLPNFLALAVSICTHAVGSGFVSVCLSSSSRSRPPSLLPPSSLPPPTFSFCLSLALSLYLALSLSIFFLQMHSVLL